MTVGVQAGRSAHADRRLRCRDLVHRWRRWLRLIDENKSRGASRYAQYYAHPLHRWSVTECTGLNGSHSECRCVSLGAPPCKFMTIHGVSTTNQKVACSSHAGRTTKQTTYPLDHSRGNRVGSNAGSNRVWFQDFVHLGSNLLLYFGKNVSVGLHREGHLRVAE